MATCPRFVFHVGYSPRVSSRLFTQLPSSEGINCSVPLIGQWNKYTADQKRLLYTCVFHLCDWVCLSKSYTIHFEAHVVFLVLQEVTSPVPSVVAVGNELWTIYFDNVCVLSKPANYKQALEAWFSVFWVFSVKYPVNLQNTCLFIEKYCLDSRRMCRGLLGDLLKKLFANLPTLENTFFW